MLQQRRREEMEQRRREREDARRLQDVALARVILFWVQSKARPATFLDGQEVRAVLPSLGILRTEREEADCTLAISRPSAAAEFPDVVYRRAHVRSRGGVPHVMSWLVHRDNLAAFNQKLQQLQGRYTTRAVGALLGYLQPHNVIREKSNYVACWETTLGSGHGEIFREGLLSLDGQQLREKLARLQTGAPPDTKVNLRIIIVHGGRPQNVDLESLGRTPSPSTQHRFHANTRREFRMTL